MNMSLIAPALWIAGILTLFLQLFDYVLAIGFMDPIISLVFFFLTQELSNFFAQMTIGEDNGEGGN